MKRKRNNTAVIPGEPGQWAVNNSVKNRAFRYVRNILSEPKRNEFEWYFGKRGRNYATMGPRGKLTGFAILGPNRPSGTVRLYLVGSKPGRGVGGVLMQQIENNARQRGVRKIRIMDPVNNARGFYQHLGFGPASRGT
jgi:GNAT superfamily N-acetyltransferase